MKLIEEIVEELKIVSTEYNGEGDKEVINLKLDLLLQRIEKIELNIEGTPYKDAPDVSKKVLFKLLYQHKYKAMKGIQALKEADNKSKYNRIARTLIARKLYFPSLHRTMTVDIDNYVIVNQMIYLNELQIFIESKGVKHEQ